MYKKTVEYTDFDGNARKEDCYFNLSKPELAKLQLSENGGLDKVITRFIQEQDTSKLVGFIDDFILLSYGKKSDDGKMFMKSEEISNMFKSTGAYEVIFMELVSDTQNVINFFKGVLPKDLSEKLPSDVATLEAEAKKYLP